MIYNKDEINGILKHKISSEEKDGKYLIKTTFIPKKDVQYKGGKLILKSYSNVFVYKTNVETAKIFLCEKIYDFFVIDFLIEKKQEYLEVKLMNIVEKSFYSHNY